MKTVQVNGSSFGIAGGGVYISNKNGNGIVFVPKKDLYELLKILEKKA